MENIGGQISLRLPKKIQINGDETVTINRTDLKDERTFCLKVSPRHVDSIAMSLMKIGFKRPSLTFKMGEKYSLSKLIMFPWELHVRIYNNGCIYSHVEIYRKYVQHLLGYTFPSIEEAFSLISKIQDVEMNYRNMKLTKILEYETFKLKTPRLLLPWKPFFLLTAFVAGFHLGKHLRKNRTSS